MSLELKIFLLALLVNVVYVLLDKFKVIDHYYTNAPTLFIRKMFDCDFCLYHNFGVVIVAIFGIFEGYEWVDLCVPLMSASLINMVKK